MTLIYDVVGVEINKNSQTTVWGHIEYKMYFETQKHKYFDLSAESLE